MLQSVSNAELCQQHFDIFMGKKRVRNISLKTECDMETDMKHTTRVRLVTYRNGAQKSHDMYS